MEFKKISIEDIIIFSESDNHGNPSSYIKLEDNRWYPHDRSGNRLEYLCSYDEMLPLNVCDFGSPYLVRQNALWGVLNHCGNYAVPLSYSSIIQIDRYFRCFYSSPTGEPVFDFYDICGNLIYNCSKRCVLSDLEAPYYLITDENGTKKIYNCFNEKFLEEDISKLLIFADRRPLAQRYRQHQGIMLIFCGRTYFLRDVSFLQSGDLIEVFDITAEDVYLLVTRHKKQMIINQQGLPALPYWTNRVKKYYLSNSLIMNFLGYPVSPQTSVDLNIVMVADGDGVELVEIQRNKESIVTQQIDFIYNTLEYYKALYLIVKPAEQTSFLAKELAGHVENPIVISGKDLVPAVVNQLQQQLPDPYLEFDGYKTIIVDNLFFVDEKPVTQKALTTLFVSLVAKSKQLIIICETEVLYQVGLDDVNWQPSMMYLD